MKVLKVPLFKQKRNTCGATALRMVFAYYGKNISEAEVIKSLGGLKSYGVHTVKLADVAKKFGFKTVCLSFNRKLSDGKAKIKRPETDDILKFLKRDIPVIINVRSAFIYDTKPSKQGHFIIITGYNKKEFTYNDPYDGKSHKIDADKLRFAWFSNAVDSSAHLLAIKPNKQK